MFEHQYKLLGIDGHRLPIRRCKQELRIGCFLYQWRTVLLDSYDGYLWLLKCITSDFEWVEVGTSDLPLISFWRSQRRFLFNLGLIIRKLITCRSRGPEWCPGSNWWYTEYPSDNSAQLWKNLHLYIYNIEEAVAEGMEKLSLMNRQAGSSTGTDFSHVDKNSSIWPRKINGHLVFSPGKSLNGLTTNLEI